MQLSLYGSTTSPIVLSRGRPSLITRSNLRRRRGLISVRQCRATLVFLPIVLAIAQTSSIAQQQAAPMQAIRSFLPDAPSPQSAVQSSSGGSSSEEGTASVSGTVLDPTGAAVSGAQVSLVLRNGKTIHAVTSGPHGEFSFAKLFAGSYLVTIKAQGFALFTSPEFALTAQRNYELPGAILPIAGASTDIVVRPTEVIAAEQIKEEEKQRLLGILPDFYVSYVWDAAPLNTKQKYSLALRDTLDPTTFIGVSIGAGIQQARNSFPGFGQGAAGYGKRWGALFANGRTSDFLSRAVFPSMFHQDPRYFYQGSAGTPWSRTKHAIAYAFVARSDSGRLMPNYSLFLGNLSSGALSNVYYPDSSRGAGLVFENAALGFLGRINQNLAHEFVFRHLTKHVPGKGKPTTDPGNP